MRKTTKTSGKAAVNRKINAAVSARLWASSLPTLIEAEAENRRALAMAEDLIRKDKQRTPEETALLKGRYVRSCQWQARDQQSSG